jgi:hypothetical protein
MFLVAFVAVLGGWAALVEFAGRNQAKTIAGLPLTAIESGSVAPMVLAVSLWRRAVARRRPGVVDLGRVRRRRAQAQLSEQE